MSIHPTAVISPRARLGINITIEPFAVIHAGVTLHDNVVVRSHAVIGAPGEKAGYMMSEGLGVEIGDATIVSDFVSIHSGIIRRTTIGRNCLLLAHSHVGHCATIRNNVIVSCGALIGGESVIDDGANIALNATLHQQSYVGCYAMVGMGAVVPKRRRILPGQIYAGNPARYIKPNEVGLKRAGVSEEAIWQARSQYIEATEGWAHR